MKNNLVINPSFEINDEVTTGWETAEPTDLQRQIYKRVATDQRVCLAIYSSKDRRSFGFWRGQTLIKEGRWYKAGVKARIKNIENPHLSLYAQVGFHFLKIKSIEKVSPDESEISFEQVFKYDNVGDGSTFDLFLRCAPEGQVLWYDPEVIEIPEPDFSFARVATIRFGKESKPISLGQQLINIEEKLDYAGKLSPDVILLTELCPITNVSSKEYMPFNKIAEEVPHGPCCSIFSKMAKKHKAYVIGGIAELKDGFLYNTAVIFDRNGEFLGKYVKTHLTFMEQLWGFVPGDEYPVFDLDFGRIGVTICYDEWFPEIYRIYGNKGAQAVFLPVMGGKPIVWRTRAIDNGYYVITSSVNPPSMIIDSSGLIISEVARDGVAVANLNMDYRETNVYIDPTYTHGMPGCLREKRNCIDYGFMEELFQQMTGMG